MNWFKLQLKMKFRLKLLFKFGQSRPPYFSRYVKYKVDSWQMFLLHLEYVQKVRILKICIEIVEI